MSRHRLSVFALLAGLTLAARPASGQVTFDFANLKYINSTFSGFLPTDGVFCTGGDLCSSNVNGGVFGDDLTYINGGLTVLATAYYTSNNVTSLVSAVQDHENSYNGVLYGRNTNGAGLGVYHLSNVGSDDNITAGEKLKLSFLTAVTINTIGLRSEGHNTTGWLQGATFQFSTDNINWTTALLPANSGRVDLNLTGQDFYFQYGGNTADQFYLSSVTATGVVPEPSTYMLMAVGLLGLGAAARRKRASTL